VHIKALTAVEIAHIARIEKMSWHDVLVALRDAGLDTLPGGGAETFSAAVREQIADKKLGGADFIGVHRTAHRLGIRSNCTMLYGHVETYEDRVAHLAMLRNLQDETGGFLAYIPLAYHPDDNELGKRLGLEGQSTTGFDDLRNLAVGRLTRQLPAHQDTLTTVRRFLADGAAFGVNDLEDRGAEKIYHAAGAHTPQDAARGDPEAIRGARRILPSDSFYNIHALHEHAAEAA
jgi:aminodeoxyfutalosine synthase